MDVSKCLNMRLIGFVSVFVLLYSCSPKGLTTDSSQELVTDKENIAFSTKYMSVKGNIQPFNSEISVDTLAENLYLINLNLYTDFPSSLPKFQFDIKYPKNLVGSLWSSRTWSNSSFINIPNYSRLQSDDNLLSVISLNNNNRMTLTSWDDFKGRYTQIDVKQAVDSLVLSFNFFNNTAPDAEMLEYKIKILVDLTDRNFSKSVRESAQWLLDQKKDSRITKIDLSLQPIYSLWYPMDRNIPLENITYYFDSIASMGFRSVLFDDGWQNVVRFDVDSLGNWDPSKTNVVKEFMAKVREKDMKIALWYSQPFIGAHNYVFKRFEDNYLQYITSSQPILDIRYPEVRDYLTKMYTNIISEWGVDGIWFNFLNGYYPDEHVIVTEDKGRDYVSVRKGLDSLRIYMEGEMYAANENISINQSYPAVGPLHTSNTKTINGFLGTTVLNEVREKLVNNRLMYGEYSPFMEVMGIHPKDPAVDVAKKFQSIMYGIPYISYFSYTLPEDIRQTVSFWIQYWKTNVEYLIESDFEVQNPVRKYPVISAGNEVKQIVTLYDRQPPIDLGFFSFETADVINSSSYASVSVSGTPTGKIDFIIYNYKGVYQSRGTLKFKKDIASLNIPSGGFARLIVK